MNLVCKEYVSCRADNFGALVLSEHAGAAIQMPDAFATLVTGDAGVKVGEGLTCAEFRVGSTTVVREVLTLVASARGSTVSERPAGSPPDSTTPS